MAVFEYHVVYSQAYAVPVLYFSVTELDGTPISGDEAVWRHLPNHDENTLAQMREQTAVSQADHPALQRPFYFVHPCRTAEMLAATAVDGAATPPAELNVVLSWLSLTGREVGLNNVPLPAELQPLAETIQSRQA
eukprot:m.321587 g.321587  ORF g.321587 m.321587 type:complete len:135 (-) comp27594_c2_seq2:3924-4328(-)